jgi:hypothetical protein
MSAACLRVDRAQRGSDARDLRESAWQLKKPHRRAEPSFAQAACSVNGMRGALLEPDRSSVAPKVAVKTYLRIDRVASSG